MFFCSKKMQWQYIYFHFFSPCPCCGSAGCRCSIFSFPALEIIFISIYFPPKKQHQQPSNKNETTNFFSTKQPNCAIFSVCYFPVFFQKANQREKKKICYANIFCFPVTRRHTYSSSFYIPVMPFTSQHVQHQCSHIVTVTNIFPPFPPKSNTHSPTPCLVGWQVKNETFCIHSHFPCFLLFAPFKK